MKIFISYRRSDSAGYAGRIYDKFRSQAQGNLSFLDVEAIPLGSDFPTFISREVAACDVLLAIIGRDWIDAKDEFGARRLDDSNDFVRLEIAAALSRRIPVVPILLEDARMPRTDQLPRNLRELARRQGFVVRHASFHDDTDRLLERLHKVDRAKIFEAPLGHKAVSAVANGGNDQFVEMSPDERFGFQVGEAVVYPAHGVGIIEKIAEDEIAGMTFELFSINFKNDGLTLRVPTSKYHQVGMRKLGSLRESSAARAVLAQPAQSGGLRKWSVAAAHYEAKINSARLDTMAEVARDLYTGASYSERQLFSVALDRMVKEIALIERLSEVDIQNQLLALLAVAQGVRPEPV